MAEHPSLREFRDPTFAKLCVIESVREAKADPQAVSPLLAGCLANALDQAWRDYMRLLGEYERTMTERGLVYGELNKALGEHAPKAWDRIKEAMRRA